MQKNVLQKAKYKEGHSKFILLQKEKCEKMYNRKQNTPVHECTVMC